MNLRPALHCSQPTRNRIAPAAMSIRFAVALGLLGVSPAFAADALWNRPGGSAPAAASVPTPPLPAGRGSLTTFPNLAAFQAATASMAVNSEDFSARQPNNVSPCYEPVNHRMGQPGTNFLAPVCFEPDTLIPGFSLRSNLGYGQHGFGTMAFGAGTVGLAVPVVGAMSPATMTLIDFTDAPVAVAMDAWDWQAGSPLTFTVYDLDDAVIDTFTLMPSAPNQSVFAGFVSDTPVRRVTIAGAAGASQMISALHFGGRSGGLETVADRVDFGVLALGEEAVADVELRNTGDIPVSVGSIAALPPDGAFAVTDDGCSGATLAAGAHCTVEVRFAPELRQTQEQRWALVPGAAGDEPAAVTLLGRGALPMLTAASTLDFGDVGPGSSATGTVTLQSVGAVPVRLDSIGGVSTPFAIQSNGCGALPRLLAPGESCGIVIRFDASSPAPAYGFLQAISSDPSRPLHVRLVGNDNDAIFGDGFEVP